MNDFQVFLDKVGMYEAVGHLPTMEEATSMAEYIRTEILIFATFSIIAAGTLFIRMIMQMWKLYNKKI